MSMSKSRLESGKKEVGLGIVKSTYDLKKPGKLEGFSNPAPTPKTINSASHGRPRNG